MGTKVKTFKILRVKMIRLGSISSSLHKNAVIQNMNINAPMQTLFQLSKRIKKTYLSHL